MTESLYAYAWDDKHDGKHENWHDDLYPHGDKHINKHDKDGIYNFQIIGTKRTFEYDDDGKLIRATENEDRQGTYVYDYEYDDMGNRIFYKKARNGVTQESAEYTYNAANQMVAAKLFDGKHYKNVEYTYDANGNRILQEEVKDDGDRKVELTYDYSVENRLKAVSDKNDLLVAMAYDGDGNRIFQLNYNLHTDDDWKGNSGNGNGNNKDNSGSGNSGNTSGNGTGSKDKKGILESLGSFFGLDDGTEDTADTTETATTSDATVKKSNGNKDKDKGNNGNDKNNGKGNGGSKGDSGSSGNNGNGSSGPNDNTSTGGVNDNNGNANGNTNNTGGSTNQSGILFPIDGEVSELEAELIGMIKTTGKEKNYELVEYVNDVNREHTEVLMELNINGIMDTAYSYGNERLTNERFTEWTGYYTYDPRGSVTGVTDSEGMIWQSYRYNANGDITFGKPQYNNVYSYNAESYNPNMESQYLRARYYNVPNGNFLTEDSYLGNITDPLTLNRYNYVKSSPLNYIDPSGFTPIAIYDFFQKYEGTYTWTAKGDLYTITINNETLKCDGSGSNWHGMTIWLEDGILMAEDYDLAYFFKVSGWIEYMPGFQWMEDYLFSVKTHEYFLSIPFNRDFAKEVTKMKGDDSFYEGLTEEGIAAEAFAHAFLYYVTNPIKDLHPKIKKTNESGEVIDVASGDDRINTFKMIWDAVRWSDLPYKHEIFIK